MLWVIIKRFLFDLMCGIKLCLLVFFVYVCEKGVKVKIFMLYMCIFCSLVFCVKSGKMVLMGIFIF